MDIWILFWIDIREEEDLRDNPKGKGGNKTGFNHEGNHDCMSSVSNTLR